MRTTPKKSRRIWGPTEGSRVSAASDLLEREGELAQLGALVGAAREGAGRLVLVEGGAGIGKTRLLAAAREQGAGAGMEVLHARGGELEREFPFGIVRQLFEPALAGGGKAERRDVLSGAAGLASRLFSGDYLTDRTSTKGDSAFATLHGLFWLTSNLAARRPLVLAIDDLHWADKPSLRWLAYLVRRLEGLPVLAVACLRPADAGSEESPLAQLLSDPAAFIVRPAPLSEASVALLVRERLSAEADSEFCAACFAATGGNPLLVHELIGALESEGVSPTAERAALVREIGPQGVVRSVRARLSQLPPEATSLARAVAILGDDVELHHAAAVAELDRETALEAAAVLGRVDILRAELPLGFVHPVVRAAVYSGLPPAERERGHARAATILAETTAPVEQVASQLLLVSPSADARVVATLREAASRSLAQGAAENSVAYLRRALEEPPRAEERADVLQELGSAERLTLAAGATDHLREALALMEDPRRRGETALELGRMLFWSGGRGEEAVQVFEHAIAELADADPDLWQRLEAGLLTIALEEPALYARIATRLERLRAEPLDETLGGRIRLAALAYHDARAGASLASCVARAERALSGGTVYGHEGGMGWCHVGFVLVNADRFDAAYRVYDTALADARDRGSVFAFALACMLRGGAAYLRGSLADAEADLRLAIEACESNRLAAGLPTPFAYLADTLIALGRRYEAIGGRNPAFFSWRSEAALALLELGEQEEARRLAAEEVELARQWGAPRALGHALRTAALVEEAEAGLALLRKAVEVLEDSPALLERARALTELGAALRRGNRRADAREPLRQGLELAHTCGAKPLAERAHTELLATGARPRRLVLTGLDSLTPSERRVAAMAADGMTNREIAQALFVTPRTVEVHLSNAYRKLGISSRSQLPHTLTAPLVARSQAEPAALATP